MRTVELMPVLAYLATI